MYRKGKIAAFATKAGSLFYLKYCHKEKVNMMNADSKEQLWHHRLWTLRRTENLQKLDFDTRKRIGFCETYVGGKHYRSPFEKSKRHTTELLELVHSDVCGKKWPRSPKEEQEYILTFVDDHSWYAWAYSLKTKDQVFERLCNGRRTNPVEINSKC